MGGFLVWLVIILLMIANANNKKKKQQAAKPSAPAQPGSVTPEAQAKLEALRAQAAQARAVPLAQMSAQERAARMRELKEKRAARVANARGTAAQAAQTFAEGESYGGTLSRQGVSATDDEGCVGGSLPHDHSEGESRAEHGAHIAAMRARDAEEAAVAAPGKLADFDPRDLRRAVVISEILGKPRALKASGIRR